MHIYFLLYYYLNNGKKQQFHWQGFHAHKEAFVSMYVAVTASAFSCFDYTTLGLPV